MLKKAECYLLMKEYGEASSYAVYVRRVARGWSHGSACRGILQSDPTNPGAWFIRGQCSYFDVCLVSLLFCLADAARGTQRRPRTCSSAR